MYLTMETSLFCILYILSAFCITNTFTHQAYSLCLEHQNNLLLQLRTQFVFSSSLSTKLVKWNESKEECCSWGGVECDAEGHVISLQLNNETISGEINDSSILFSFRHLQKLNLAENHFGGSMIPSAIHNLTHLTHLNLSYSNFSGQVPLGLSSLTSLVSLDLSSQYGLKIENPNLKTILQNLTSLKELYLDGVNISTTGDDWSYIISSSSPNLQSLSLRNCRLSGPLHSSLLQLHSLSILQLDNNSLGPTVPAFFAKFSNLTALSLAECDLIGFFPKKIFYMPTLEYLDLSNNPNLSGIIPQFSLARSFRIMRLRDTNFSGSLTHSIGNLHMLSVLDFSGSKFIGTIPFALANLTELTDLDLSNNFFSGPIPSFYTLKKLVNINLGNNKLEGSLSSIDFEGNSNLHLLDLRNNLLNGSIPQSLFGIPSLNFLQLSYNDFSGPIHEFPTSSFSNLERIDLRGNNLEGHIPESFFKLKNLRDLSLSYNSFNGTIDFGKFKTPLWFLDISNNNLSIDANTINSSMPAFSKLTFLSLASCNLLNFPNLRNQSDLYDLDLSNNQITGEIPSWIWEIGNGKLRYLNLSSNVLVELQKPYTISHSLKILDLHSNQLEGQLHSIPLRVEYMDFSNNKIESFLPLTLGNFSLSTIFISLANNSIRGTIPASLCNATGLQILDFSNNKLTNNVPLCLLQNLEDLMVLNLGRNRLSGNIPDSFSRNCSLQTLDLENNNLGGKIPPSLAKCKSLEVLNIGSNQMEDSFPCKMPSSLRVLILRRNKFHGEVMSCLESWANLQIIDIASNNFSGYLDSMNFSSWRGMLQDNDAQNLMPNHLAAKSIGLEYVDTLTLTFKGLELELVKVLTIFTSIDLSCNNFQGEIPNAIGDFKSLYVLNLSHNALTGTIPKSFGNLIELGSLDLSMNQLTGEIPKGLAGLTFLSVLNLSYNELVGAIPQGSQIRTFEASSFQGNPGLCGFPLKKMCSNTHGTGASGVEEQSREKEEIEWEYISAALGYGVGLGSIVWMLFGCERINRIFSEKVDEILEYIFFVRQQNRRRARRRRVQRNELRRQ